MAALATILATTFPLPVMTETETVKVALGPTLGVTVATSVPPTVLPVKLMSLGAKPVTGSLKTTVKRMGPTLVGSGWAAAWLMVTVGLVLSKVTVLSVLVE